MPDDRARGDPAPRGGDPRLRTPESGRRWRPWQRGHRWRRWLAGWLFVGALAGLESIPGVPGHHQAAALGELAVSDAAATGTHVLPFLGPQPVQTCTALESTYETGNDLLLDYAIGWYASIWSSYQALNALYFGSLLPGGQGCRADLDANLRAIDARYWDTSYRRAPAAFDQGPAALHFHIDPPRVDDSLWMGLALDREYLITRDPTLRQRAEAVFRMAVANWDSLDGGIYWENHTDGGTGYERAMVSNAPAVVLGAALYAQTGRSSYLTWSARILGWVESHLYDPGPGLYDDHVGDPGRTSIDADKLTYNQGIMVGALAALATVDPGQYRLSSAVQLAERSMAYFSAHHTYGTPAWDAVWAENLLWTAGLYDNAAFARRARASVEGARNADPAGSLDLLDHAGEISLQELARLPAGDYRRLGEVNGPPGP